MNKYINTEISQHLMHLLQIGANVQVVSGKMVYVKFQVSDDIEVSYVYHINKKNKYFLERIKPYPLAIKEYDSAKEVVDIIKIDVAQFQNAVKSKNIYQFININKELNQTIKCFEDLFLYYNVPTETIKEIKENIITAREKITKVKDDLDRVFFDKNPDNL